MSFRTCDAYCVILPFDLATLRKSWRLDSLLLRRGRGQTRLKPLERASIQPPTATLRSPRSRRSSRPSHDSSTSLDGKDSPLLKRTPIMNTFSLTRRLRIEMLLIVAPRMNPVQPLLHVEIAGGVMLAAHWRRRDQ